MQMPLRVASLPRPLESVLAQPSVRRTHWLITGARHAGSVREIAEIAGRLLPARLGTFWQDNTAISLTVLKADDSGKPSSQHASSPHVYALECQAPEIRQTGVNRGTLQRPPHHRCGKRVTIPYSASLIRLRHHHNFPGADRTPCLLRRCAGRSPLPYAVSLKLSGCDPDQRLASPPRRPPHIYRARADLPPPPPALRAGR